MVDVTHDEAVDILKATEERVVLRIEKNAITDAAQEVRMCGVFVYLTLCTLYEHLNSLGPIKILLKEAEIMY